MTIYLTSFKAFESQRERKAQDFPDAAYFVSVYPPKWAKRHPKIDLFDIRDEKGQWIRPRNFGGDLERYHDALLDLWAVRLMTDYGGLPDEFYDIEDEEDSPTRDITLLCWCPYSEPAKKQIAQFGTFVCHHWPIETFLMEGFGARVVRDKDRAERMVRGGSLASATSDHPA